MSESAVLPEKFMESIKHEGVVSVVSWADGDAHVANTWNTFLVVTDDERILIPAYGFRKTEKNVNINNKVKIALGTRNVTGYKDYPGIGFVVDGTAKYLNEGVDFDLMKEKYSWLTRVMEVTVVKVKQTV